VNDSIDDAHRLCALMDGLGCTVNLLPFNPYPGSAFKRPDETAIAAFRSILVEKSIIAVIRESRGRDISAACGQLKTETRQGRKSS
ncbi:MAG: 23S rRNA (adenine(2503)-C(2))-methyltransferase RlmN, partial [Mariprofundus sp.]